MAAARDDDYISSRLLLAVMSMVLFAVAAVEFVGRVLALDPDDRVQDFAILTPAGVAACGIALAAVGGRVARAVSGVVGALLAAAAVWMLAAAEPSEWFVSRSAAVLALCTLGVAVVGAAAVAVAARGALSDRAVRTRPEPVAGQPHRVGLAGRLRQIVSWLLVGALIAIAAWTGWRWYQDTVLAPPCGEIAETQLRAAMGELQREFPGLRFTGVETSCDSVFEAYAQWEHDDAQELSAEARAAGCVVNESALYGDDEEDFLTCGTSGRRVIFTIELPASVPVSGYLTMT